MGMHKEALDVLKEGLTHYPGHTTALMTLASIYYEKKIYAKALKILRPLVSDNMANERLQKLYIKACLKDGHHEEAIGVLKTLQFLNPQDPEVKKDLDQLLGQEEVESEQSPHSSSSSEVFDENESSIDDWAQISFSRQKQAKPSLSGKNNDDEELMMTHTLVDLYEEQGCVDKAVETLEKIVHANPSDLSSKIRLEGLQGDIVAQREQGHDLMGLWDKKFSNQSKDTPVRSEEEGVKKVLLNFLQAVKLKSSERKESYGQS